MRLLVLCVCLLPLSALGQIDEGNAARGEVREAMYSGAKSMDEGHYREAEEYFLWVLENATRLPAELAYYFGKNSYFLGKDRQAIDWLSKYIELKGTRGLFYQEAKQYLELAEGRVGMQAEMAQQPGITPDRVTFSLAVDCNRHPELLCPVCLGDGVIIASGLLGRRYSTCPECGGDGAISCEAFNALVEPEEEAP